MLDNIYFIKPRADLSGADLSGADLSGAHLGRADLSGADLSGADLSRAHLSDADLSGANLRGAHLGRAHLSGAGLSGADLSGADLGRANLFRTRFLNAEGILLLPVQDCRGYGFCHAIKCGNNWRVRIGCRDFRIDEALQHWGNSYTGDREQGDLYLSAIDWLEHQIEKE